MRENNDVELAEWVRKVQEAASVLDREMANGSPNSVMTAASIIEDAARKLGWCAWDLHRQRIKERAHG